MNQGDKQYRNSMNLYINDEVTCASSIETCVLVIITRCPILFLWSNRTISRVTRTKAILLATPSRDV